MLFARYARKKVPTSPAARNAEKRGARVTAGRKEAVQDGMSVMEIESDYSTHSHDIYIQWLQRILVLSIA